MFTKVFLNYTLNVVDKGIFPYMSKQESIKNAGESFFQVYMFHGTYTCGLTGFVVAEILVLYL